MFAFISSWIYLHEVPLAVLTAVLLLRVRIEVTPVGLAGAVAEVPVGVAREPARLRLTFVEDAVPTDVLEELAPFRFAEVVAVVSVGLRKEPERPRFNWVVAKLPVAVFEELAPFRFAEVVAVVSVGLLIEPARVR